ncbi:hypothetical protein NONO_c26780 [Nocardia nova SH22a]|uniref:DUF998 domain-containing protein n=1 Tax=Nocardia nova SH22a TaxID=1415166 RepID=W5TDQ7_9NOCA|nr:hypothetical protein [Nocardia nova]AHH17470.1 hypothetical protein NONO_c26780 [Nocardia nova SH22a]
MTTISDSARAADRTTTTLAGLSVLAIWLGLFGPAWQFAPGNGAGTASTEYNFAGLVAAYEHGSNALQSAFFLWLAWFLALLTTVVVLVAARSWNPFVGAAAVVAGVVQMLVTMFAFKGDGSWADLIGGFHYTRLGAVLFYAGFVLLIVVGVRCVLRAGVPGTAPVPEPQIATGTA